MITVIFAIFGLAIGSFLNVLIVRIPEGKNIAFPASHCPQCKTPLKLYHNIPIFSWVFLKGRCAFCKKPIKIQYPLVELLTGLIFAVCAQEESLLDAILLSSTFSLLLALSIIDLKYKAVPDSLSLPALLLAICAGDILLSLEQALLYAGGFALLRIFVSFLVKKEAMGEADVIIAAVIGALVASPLGLVAIYIGAVIALPVFFIVSKRNFEMPFIPFLALGVWITYIFDEPLIKWVGTIYG